MLLRYVITDRMSQWILQCRSMIGFQLNDRRQRYPIFCSYRMEYMAELASICGRQRSALCWSPSLAFLLSLLSGVSSTQYTAQRSLLEIWTRTKRCEGTASTWQNKSFSSPKPACTPAGPLLVWTVYSLVQPRKFQISGDRFFSFAYHIMLPFFLYGTDRVSQNVGRKLAVYAA